MKSNAKMPPFAGVRGNAQGSSMARCKSHCRLQCWGSSTNDFWRQKTGVPGLSRGVVCVILRLAVLIQCRRVTDTQTHTQTHDDGYYPRIASVARVKILVLRHPVGDLGVTHRFIYGSMYSALSTLSLTSILTGHSAGHSLHHLLSR